MITGTSGWRTSALADLAAAAVHDVDDARPAARPPRAARRSARRAAACPCAGLKTTVLPQTSAGAIFQVGIAIGKFHGVITPTTPIGIAHAHRELVAQLATASSGRTGAGPRRPCRSSCRSLPGRRRRPRRSTLPISRAHQLGELVLVARSSSAGEAEEDLAAPRRRHEPPLLVGRLRRRDRAVDVLRRRTSGRCRASRRSRGSATRRSRRRRRPPTRRRCSS